MLQATIEGPPYHDWVETGSKNHHQHHHHHVVPPLCLVVTLLLVGIGEVVMADWLRLWNLPWWHSRWYHRVCWPLNFIRLTLNQPRTHECAVSLHKILYGVIILGANTLNFNFCLFQEIPMASKGLKERERGWRKLSGKSVPCLEVRASTNQIVRFKLPSSKYCVNCTQPLLFPLRVKICSLMKPLKRDMRSGVCPTLNSPRLFRWETSLCRRWLGTNRTGNRKIAKLLRLLDYGIL